MAQARHVDMNRFLPLALAVTSGVLLLPLAVVMAALTILNPDPHPLVTSALGLLIAIATTVIGSSLWMRNPASRDIAFGELMIWGWYRRKRAEDQLLESTRLLGLDRSGRVESGAPLSPREQIEVLKDLSAALEAKDPYTHGHSRRVERHAYRIGLAMGLHVADIEDLRMAAALHDVGKIRVSDRVLRKPGALTPEERSIMEEHVAVGAWMVSKVGSVDVTMAVRHHHEHWNGAGYPDGIAGTDIPLFARIIAVADAYDAITSTRPYRSKSGREGAIEILRAEAGKQFDPQVVEAFLKTLPMPATVPAAVSLLFFGGGTRLVRELAVLMKRVGATSIAPAAGAAGAAVVLGVSAVGPGFVGTPPAPRIAVQKEASPMLDMSMGAKMPLGVRAVKTTDVVLGERIERHKKKPAAPVAAAPARSAPKVESSSAPAKPRAEAPVEVADVLGDPQPEHGNDCASDKKDSRGNSKHCG